MSFGPSRPPVTEGIADVIVKDIKSGEGQGTTSEVPLAFQAGTTRPPVDPVVIGETRKQMTMFGLFAAAVVLILLVIWYIA